MADISTYILLDRNLLGWRWFCEPNTAHLFIYCLLKANSRKKEFKNITVHRGEFITSLAHMSQDTGLTQSQVRTALDHLIETGEIASNSTNKYTVINVVNYDVYQDYEKYNRKQHRKQITNESQTNHNQIATTNTVNTVNTDNTVKENTFSLREIEEMRNQ